MKAKIHTEEDAILLGKLKQSSSDAFNALYDKYWQQVYAAAFKRLKDAGQAKDITQDVFLALWKNRFEQSITNLPAYIYTSVRNRVLNKIEAEKKFVPVSDLLIRDLPAHAVDQADAATIKNELLRSYRMLIESLPTERQKIFRLRYEHGSSTEDIAKQLQISRKTVQNQLGKALAHLRVSIAQFVCAFIVIFPY